MTDSSEATRSSDLRVPDADRWLLVVGMGLAVFMAQLDTSIVTVALPIIESDLNSSTIVSQWVVLAYLVPVIALTLPAGRWLDRVGERAALLGSVSGFALASVAAGLAPTMATLIAARVGQGVFAAVLFALIPAVATTAVRPHLRGRAMAVVTTVGPMGAVAGPGIGGLLIELAGWPWIFFVNVPVAVAVVVIARSQLPPGRGLQWPGRAVAGEVALFGAAAVAVLLGFTLGASSGPYWLLLTALAVPLLSVWWRTTASRPVRDLFRIPGIAGPHLALSTEMAAVLLVIFLAPFYLQRVLEVPVATTGLTVLALPAAMTLAAPIGGVLADLWGARRTALLGSAVVIIGLALVAPLAPDWTPAALAWRFAVIGAGAGLFAAPNLTMAMAATPPDRLHTTGATTSLARQLGISLGPALGTAVWTLAGGTGGMRLAVWVAVAMAAVSLLTLILDRRPTNASDVRSGRRTDNRPDQPSSDQQRSVATPNRTPHPTGGRKS